MFLNQVAYNLLEIAPSRKWRTLNLHRFHIFFASNQTNDLGSSIFEFFAYFFPCDAEIISFLSVYSIHWCSEAPAPLWNVSSNRIGKRTARRRNILIRNLFGIDAGLQSYCPKSVSETHRSVSQPARHVHPRRSIAKRPSWCANQSDACSDGISAIFG